MKKLITFIFTLFLLSGSWAQEGGRMSFELYESFKGDTLLVLLTNDSIYNDAMRQTISSHWKTNPYRFVTEKQLLPLANRQDYTMLVPDNSSKTRGRSVIKRHHLSLFPCGRSADLTKYGGKYAIAQFSIKEIDQPNKFVGKLPFLIQSMQQYLTFLDSVQNLGEDTYDPKLNRWKNMNRQDIQDMTLIVPSDYLSKDMSESKLKALYKHPLKVVRVTEIDKYMNMEEGPRALLHLDARKRYISVIGEDGRVLYHAESNSPGSFTPKDLKVLFKATEKPFEEGKSLENRINRLNGKLNKALGSGR